VTDSVSYLAYDFPPGAIGVVDMLGQIAAGLKASGWDQPFDFYQDARSGEIAAVGGPPNPEQLMKVYAEAEGILLTALRRRALSAQVGSDGARRQIAATFWQTGAGLDSFRDRRVDGAGFFVDETCFDVWLGQLLLARKGRNDDARDAPQSGDVKVDEEADAAARKALKPRDDAYGQKITNVIKAAQTLFGAPSSKTPGQMAKSLLRDKTFGRGLGYSEVSITKILEGTYRAMTTRGIKSPYAR
jgi:hypothetical protein